MPFFATVLDVGPDQLIRVDEPDFPGAIATSDRGSVLLEPPPAGTRWRYEPFPETQAFVASEAIEALDATPWHDAGLDGTGVKIAVFDVQWYGLEAFDELAAATLHDCRTQTSCELAMDTFRPTFSFETGQHGVACAEIVQAIAPGAELHVVNVSGLTTLENAVDWAVREGIDVVSMSLSFFNESFYDGTGAVDLAMEELAAGGTLMVAAAGNYAQQHFQDTFRDDDFDDRHDYAWGTEFLAIYVDPGDTTIYLSWDQFGGDCGETDLDAYVYDYDGHLVGRSTDEQDPDADHCDPIERPSVHLDAQQWIYVVVHRKRGAALELPFRVLTRGGSIYRKVPEGSVTDPGTSSAVFTVGAVNAVGYLDNEPETYSSQGPTSSGLRKPDILGPDGVSSTVYGSRGFYGTSAATPAVAAAVALVLSEDPSLTPFEAADRLRSHAIDLTPAWAEPSAAEGAGYARLPEPGAPKDGDGCGSSRAIAFLPILAFHRRRRRRQ